MWLSLVGILVLLTWLVLGTRAFLGLVRSVDLPHTPSAHISAPSHGLGAVSGSLDSASVPKVSVILSAKNEALALPKTLASLRAQTWPKLEVIAVNDRSTDQTGKVLDEAKSDWPELQVIDIKDLPAGWLGKNHALYKASKQARGEWLLFTDADVTFSNDAVASAMHHVLESHRDHLALAPNLVAKGFWLSAVVYLFLYNIVMVFRPQDAERPKSSAFVGIGAFNLIRKATYEAVGGHKAVALRPDEDLALGASIKRAGFHQQFAGGTKLLQVEWYPSLSEMARGLEKNALAPFQYRFSYFTLGVLMLLLVYDGPFLGAVFATGWIRFLFALAFVIELCMFHLTRRYSGVSVLWGLTLPLAAPVLFFILVRSALLCLRRGGIEWRGTFYSLRDLRKGVR
ncbi:glycosyltransferase [Alicyclobacillus ferrooxydans]|uniref:4,4'-diaponeurosporenoate glycosyltransferase n=1 Tax=Alicyclobacillus ferrooxydans TaxID=471514 RepID=A0A0P9D1P2_9BACL|nr:glycosyltransferase [Alicyclobacillus ferrooxydans]KPV43431.1 hypothetical protein AN477_12625 [Alicyclobacillus ferrooxydans]